MTPSIFRISASRSRQAAGAWLHGRGLMHKQLPPMNDPGAGWPPFGDARERTE